MVYLTGYLCRVPRRLLPLMHRDSLLERRQLFRGVMICLLILMGLPPTFAATLTGTVVDARTGEPIANAEVSIMGSQSKVRTDENGGFTLTDLPTGDLQLLTTCIGYDRATRTVHVVSDAPASTVITLYLEASTPTQTVSVTASVFDALDATNPSSEETLSKQEIQSLSLVLLGDPMRAAQALPGVVSSNDFDSKFSLRGAGPDEIGVYIDGIGTHNFFNTLSFSSGGVSGTAPYPAHCQCGHGVRYVSAEKRLPFKLRR
jgi:hypothetical protein